MKKIQISNLITSKFFIIDAQTQSFARQVMCEKKNNIYSLHFNSYDTFGQTYMPQYFTIDAAISCFNNLKNLAPIDIRIFDEKGLEIVDFEKKQNILNNLTIAEHKTQTLNEALLHDSISINKIASKFKTQKQLNDLLISARNNISSLSSTKVKQLVDILTN